MREEKTSIKKTVKLRKRNSFEKKIGKIRHTGNKTESKQRAKRTPRLKCPEQSMKTKLPDESKTRSERVDLHKVGIRYQGQDKIEHHFEERR